jgi:hypothetical protein
MRRIHRNIELPAGLTVRRAVNPKIFLSYSSLDWYKLTENTRHALNNILTSSAKKQLEERLKANPDAKRLEDLQTISTIVAEISRDAKNFETKERMQEILETYAPLEII